MECKEETLSLEIRKLKFYVQGGFLGMCCLSHPSCCLQIKPQILKPKLGSPGADNLVVVLCWHFSWAMVEQGRHYRE